LSNLIFLVKQIINTTSNFTGRKLCFLSVEWYQGC
jgi:hypothetical protein